MGHLSFGIFDTDGAMLFKGTKNLTVTVDGEERVATWKQGVGIYVDGQDIGKGDRVLIEGEPHEVVEMRRMMMEGDALTLIIKASEQ